MQVSQLQPYSVGIAAENKPLDSRDLNVTPIETLPAVDGELNFNPETQTVSGTDSDGNTYEVSVTTDVTLTAQWVPKGSNRVTPPDIRRGELVEIYRMADADQYFWRSLGLRDDLRRLETVIFAFNGSPDEGSRGIDPTTCYFLEISTHQKKVTFSTSQANGEPFGYTCQFDTGNGTFTLTDSIDQQLHLNSSERFIELVNADESYLQLDRQDIHLHAHNDITARADRDISLTAGRHIQYQAGSLIQGEAGDNISLTAGSVYALEAPTMTFNGETMDITALTTINGNLILNGSFMSSGGSGGGDSMTVEGNIDFNGDLNASGTIRCTELIASDRVSAPNL